VQSESPRRIPAFTTVGTFLKRGTCSETLVNVINRAHGQPMPDEERASAPLAGGIVSNGYQCGQLWGAALAAGARSYRLNGAGAIGQAAAIAASQRVVVAFRTQNSHTDCFDLTGMDAKATKLRMVLRLAAKGGPAFCLHMAARYAPVALREIDVSLSQHDGATALPAPVGCAALLAQRMGASDLHTTMAAGLAGGIGLCGGACGALGAAIWLGRLHGLKAGAPTPPFKSPAALALVERFLKCTNYEFECSRIVGRTFEGVGDHAAHVCAGGCARLLGTLAAG
jgi:hypothetical protein